MENNKCFGVDPARGRQIAVFYDRSIRIVDDLLHEVEGLPYLAPGWIDLQVNGYAGADYCSPQTPAEKIGASIRAQYATGVTRLLPTVITGPEEAMLGALRNLAQARERIPEGRSMEGFHVEGPHISLEDGPCGAHPRESVRKPDIEEYKRWQEAARGQVRLITLSPEWPEANAYIEHIVADGVVASIGHTAATTEQIHDAVKAGATLSTHLGNGAHTMIRRHPNYIWAQLAEDGLAASFIVDGIHLPPAFLKAAVRAKGPERSVLITDAVMPAGCEPGPFRLGAVEVELHADRRVTLAGRDRLAGSALSLDRGVENLVRHAGVSLNQAITAATRNPARVARIAGRRKGLVPGDRADLVEFDWDTGTQSLTVHKTWVDGEVVFQAG